MARVFRRLFKGRRSVKRRSSRPSRSTWNRFRRFVAWLLVPPRRAPGKQPSGLQRRNWLAMRRWRSTWLNPSWWRSRRWWPFGGSAQAGTSGGAPIRSSSVRTLGGMLMVLARSLLVVQVVSTLAALFPFQPWMPFWYLRMGQVMVDYSPALLLILTLTLLGRLLNRHSRNSANPRTLARRLAGIGLWLYGLLVPVQIFCYGWLWLDSANQLQDQINNAEARLRPVQAGIRAATSQQALQAAVNNGQSMPPAPPNLPSLAEQKRQLLAYLDGDLKRLRTNLQQQRTQQLTGLLVSTGRSVVCAAAIAVAMALVSRQI